MQRIGLLALAVIWAWPTLGLAAPGDYSVVATYPSSMESADGIEYRGDGNILVTNCATEDVVVLDAADGSYQGGYVTENAMLDHMARNWLDGTIWGNEHPMAGDPMSEAAIVQFDAETGAILSDFKYERPESGTNVMGFPMGIAWNGEYVMSQDIENRIIYSFDTETGDIVDQIDSPVINGCGLGWDGVCLWVGNYDRYVQVDPATGDFVMEFTPPPPADSSAVRMFTGLSWDGQHMYIDNECPYDETVYVLEFEFDTEGPCAHKEVGEGETCDIWNARWCAEGLDCDLPDDSAWGVCVSPAGPADDDDGDDDDDTDAGGCSGCATDAASAVPAGGVVLLAGLLSLVLIRRSHGRK